LANEEIAEPAPSAREESSAQVGLLAMTQKRIPPFLNLSLTRSGRGLGVFQRCRTLPAGGSGGAPQFFNSPQDWGTKGADKDMIKKGILKSFNETTYLAAVQIAGSLSVWLENIPTSRAIAASDMVTGRSVAVLFIDPSNFSNAVVIAVWV